MLQKNDIRERLAASKEVGVDTGSSRADSHNFLPVRRSGLSEPRSRYAVLLHLEVQGLVVGSEVSGHREKQEHSGPTPPNRLQDPVLLHLEVQGLVVGSEVSGRCAPVSPGGLERLTDRLPLGIRRGRLSDLL